MPEERAEVDDDTLPPPQYTNLSHPDKTFLDKILVTYVFGFFMNLSGFLQHSPLKETPERKAFLEWIRGRMTAMEKAGVTAFVKQWHKHHGCQMAECHYQAPRDNGLLREWGIDDDGSVDPASLRFSVEGHVHTIVRFPSSLLTEEEQQALASSSNNGDNLHESSALKMEKLDFAKLPEDVPLVVYFHGGGLVIGQPNDTQLAEEVYNLASDYKKKHGEDKVRKIITVSVDYSKGPEYPFPAGIIDALSVIDHILNQDPSRKIHIYGVSAGGNIAMAAGLESFRKYPGRISSISAVVPMICPASDSKSYYMNENSGGAAPAKWLRWSWRAYLQLDPPPNEEKESENEDEDKIPDMDKEKSVRDLLRKDSNHTSWTKSKWYESKVRRLAEPMHDLPTGLDQDNAPKILVATNAADPLLDDGEAIADALKQKGAKVAYLKSPGSHLFGFKFNSEYDQKRRELLSEQFWSNS
jgi:acetyl esterase/lipase